LPAPRFSFPEAANPARQKPFFPGAKSLEKHRFLKKNTEKTRENTGFRFFKHRDFLYIPT
jgi:hypothetical protein